MRADDWKNEIDAILSFLGLCVKSVSWKDDRILVGTQNSEVFELSSRSTDKVSLLVQGHSEGELWALATHPTKANYFTTCSDDCSIQQWSITGERFLLIIYFYRIKTSTINVYYPMSVRFQRNERIKFNFGHKKCVLVVC